MKPLKKANQQNGILNTQYYNKQQQEEIKQKYYTFVLDFDYSIRLSLYYAKEIKIILNDYGYYENAIVMEDGSQYYINL